MSRPKHWWLAKSVSDDHDTMTAYDVDGDDEDWHAEKGIYVIEKSAADKLADHLDLAIAGLHGANVDVKFLVNRLKDYRGEND